MAYLKKDTEKNRGRGKEKKIFDAIKLLDFIFIFMESIKFYS